MTDDLHPTDEQVAIVDAAKSTNDNLIINALAGTGKTSTIKLIERSIKTKPVLYLVFNKKNADEATKEMLSTTTVRTFNSLGHRIWAQACSRNLKLDGKKTQGILKAIIDEAPKSARDELWASYWEVISGVAMAKALGYVPGDKFPTAKRLIEHGAFLSRLDERPDDLTADLIDEVLTRSIKAAYDGLIDFNDQIYMPALFGGTYPKFPLVCVDEYQDLNPTNHAMVDKLVKHRLMGVGDPAQSIYAFRGANPNGMAEAQAKFAMAPQDLTVSFRCPEAIVDRAKWRVPKFSAFKPGGSFEALLKLPVDDIDPYGTFICRNNAPLFAIAFRLLSHGRSVNVAGSDIGPKLLGIMRRLGPEEMTQGQALLAIDDWEAEREAKESKSAKDMAECMRVFAKQGASLGQAIRYAEHLFEQEGTIKLLTGHKAKGLEFDTVYHLDPWLVRKDPNQQDQNLDYVITTRSKDRLFEIDRQGIEW